MKRELSIFIDESGDWGSYDFHSPYYIVTMIFHDQRNSITDQISHLDKELEKLSIEDHCIHTGPIIRKEENYKYMTVEERRKIFNKMVAFIKNCGIEYKCFSVEKKQTEDAVDLSGKISKQISSFFREEYNWFLSFDTVKVYYDNGQIELSRILSAVFNVIFSHVEFRKVLPKDYKLFQAADMICTMELLSLKLKNEGLSKSELTFFGNTRDLKRNYLRQIKKLEK